MTNAHAALLTGVLLALTANACGSRAGNGAQNAANVGPGAQTSASSRGQARQSHDRDNDGDNNDDDGGLLLFGRPAPDADRQAIATLVIRYFAAAATENGKQACKLLTPFVAESVAEKDGKSPGLEGASCATVMSKLFRRHHGDLVAKRSRLKIIRVGVESNRSLVALEFPGMLEDRQVTARRDHGRWTMLTLLDGIVE